jgi:Fur family ferric uptake transcriptional regulator
MPARLGDGTTHPDPRSDLTRLHALVRSALSAQTRFVSARELFDAFEGSSSRVGLSTVYRALRALAEAGEACWIRSVAGPAIFQVIPPDGARYLVCISCGEFRPVDDGGSGRWASAVASDHGFTLLDWSRVVTCYCASCARAASQSEQRPNTSST